MVRKTALVTAMLGAFASHAYALGLGGIELNSALHQPLDAEIALLSATPEEVDQLKVRLASSEAYAQAGVERIYLHTRLKFNVVTRPDGSAVIRVTSQEPIREPYLDFMVQATWASGRLVREYTMLIDPPTLMPAEASAPAPATPTTRRQAAPAPAPEPAAPVRNRREASFTGSEYGPVQRNDTLWTIAEKVRPDAGVSMQQTMLGLVRANPEAFQHGNVNNLKAGHVLRVPAREEFTSVSQAEARTEVSRQHRLWREGRSEATQATQAMPATGEVERDVPETSEPAAAGEDAGDAAETAAANGDAKLKLVTPDAAGGAAGAGEGGAEGGVAAVRQELSLAVEELEAQRQQNEDLNERLAELEQQIAQLHRLVQLSDDELALMQGELAGGEDTAAADGETLAEADTAETPAPSAAQDTTDESAPAEPTPAEPEPTDTASAEPTPPAMQEELRAPAAPAAPAEPGLLERFLTNPLWQAGAGLVALLLLILAWLGARKRRMASTGFKESILAEPRGKDTASAAPAAAEAPAAATAAAAAAESEDKPAPAASGGPQSDSSLFTDFSVSDMGAIQNDAEADPLAEADVYLAYGRYQQAEELIRGALENEPGNTEYRLKLLEVFAAAGNQSGFDAEAEAMLAQLENQDDPAWQRVKEMGRELNPSNALYQEGGAAPAAPEAPTPAESGEDAGLADLEGLDLGETERPDTAGETEVPAEAEPDNSLDFDLGELEGFSPEEAEPEATGE